MPSAAVFSTMRRRATARFARMAAPGQVFFSLIAVIGAYLVYDFTIVPLIEPGVEYESGTRASDADIRRARESAGARKQELAEYFPPGSWELENPAIWQNDQTLILFKSPRPLPDRRLELRYCTLVWFPKPQGAPGTPRVKPIIMRASEGAELEFDQPIELKNLDLKKRQLIGGQLKGEITIRREPSKPGADDALLITTRDLVLSKDKARTPRPVEFQMGKSHGRGRELVIHLAGEVTSTAKDGAGALRMLELLHEVVMFLDLGDPSLAGKPAVDRPVQPTESQIKITCQGPFQYDFVQYAASFRDHVDVVRHASGPADLLNCELLTVFFAHDEAQPQQPGMAPAASPRGPQPAAGLNVRAIEARGDPVVLRSQARGIDLRCRGLNFLPAPGGATGRIVGLGPGAMQGDLPKDGGKYLLEWAREFRFEPDGALEVASLHGDASVRFGQMGVIKAENRVDASGTVVQEGQLFAWLTAPAKNPQAASPPDGRPPAEANKWQVERVMAQGAVTIDAPQLAGSTTRLEAWIERPRPVAAGAVPPLAAGTSPAEPAPPAARAAPRASPTERYSLVAGSIKIKLVPEGEQFTVADATLDAEAQLKQISLVPTSEKPLVVEGDHMHVTGANAPHTRITVTGQPGYLEAGGMTLRGGTIEMDKQAGRLWIDGPGRMTLPMDRDFSGKPLPNPLAVDITWRGRMNFQGKTVSYEHSVEVKSQWQLLATERLDAILTRAIDFNNPRGATQQPNERPDLAHVRTFGPVYLESREFDDRGMQTSFAQMEAFDLSLDRITGAIDARGPGTVTHVGYTSSAAAGAPLVPVAAGQPPQPRKAADKELTYLRIRFERAMTGDMNKREVTFSEPTKTVYGPIASWQERLDAEEPSTLGPNAVVLDARQVTVREMPAAVRGQPGVYELVASGNVSSEGKQFFARGQQANYSQQKDQLILQGDGRSPAEISYQSPGAGRRDARANIVIYSVKQRLVRFSGAHSVGIDILQSPKEEK